MIVHLWGLERKQEMHGVWSLVSVIRDNANNMKYYRPGEEMLTLGEHRHLRQQNGKHYALRCVT